MSLLLLKENRTRFRNLLAKELAKCKTLLDEDIEHESNTYIRDVNNCIKRLNDYIAKLEEANEVIYSNRRTGRRTGN